VEINIELPASTDGIGAKLGDNHAIVKGIKPNMRYFYRILRVKLT
jgi:hypothetical protein